MPLTKGVLYASSCSHTHHTHTLFYPDSLQVATWDSRTRSFRAPQSLVPPDAIDFFCSSTGFGDANTLVVGDEGAFARQGSLWVLKKTYKSGWSFTAGPIAPRPPVDEFERFGSTLMAARGAKYIVASATGYVDWCAACHLQCYICSYFSPPIDLNKRIHQTSDERKCAVRLYKSVRRADVFL